MYYICIIYVLYIYYIVLQYIVLSIIDWDSQELKGLTRPKLSTEHLDSRNDFVSITIGGSPVVMPVLRQV